MTRREETMTTKTRRTPRKKSEPRKNHESHEFRKRHPAFSDSSDSCHSWFPAFAFRISISLFSLCSLCLCGELVLPSVARAEHASIDLRIMRVDAQTGKAKDEVSA